MSEIFISHSSKNNERAVEIRDWLINSGWGPAQIYLDLDAISTGERWRERLTEMGQRCEAVVLCLSDAWIQSEECRKEFEHAERQGKPIFPLIIEAISQPLPPEISAIQFTDISDSTSADRGFEKLRIALQRARIGPKYFPWPANRCPYRGLQALTEQDAAVFFGRDHQISEGLSKLNEMKKGSRCRILTIAAASGAGKSSFLKAGLLARLKRDVEGFFVLPTMRPRLDALGGKEGLLNALSLSSDTRSASVLSNHLDLLRAPTMKRLENVLDGLNNDAMPVPPTIVLPLDQAEELFSPANITGIAALNLLVRCLAVTPDLLLIVTIRSDSLGDLQADSRIAELLELINLPAIPTSRFKEIIEGPGQISEPKIQIDHDLTNRLIDDLNQSDALPLLAFTLERLVESYAEDNRLELIEYTEGLGGVSGAIGAAVEAALDKALLDSELPSQRDQLLMLARKAFIPFLVQLDDVDASPKRRLTKISDIQSASQPLIKHFVNERLLVSSGQGDEFLIEVSHEAVLRNWSDLANWIDEERSMLQKLSSVERAANEWLEKTPSEGTGGDLLNHRGAPLTLALELLERSDFTKILGHQGVAYLEACRDLERRIEERERHREKRQQLLRRWGTAATMGVFFVTLAGAYFVLQGYYNLGRSESLSLSRQAEQLFSEGNALSSFRLSVIAARGTPFSSPLREAEAMVDKGALSLQQTAILPHASSIGGATFSPDSSRLLTWTGMSSGAAGANLNSMSEGLDYSPPESHWVKHSGEAIAYQWEIGAIEQGSLNFAHSDYQSDVFYPENISINDVVGVGGVQYSADQTQILTWGRQDGAQLWNVGNSTGASRAFNDPSLGDSDFYIGAELSQDKKTVLSWSNRGKVQLWDSISGNPILPDLIETASVDNEEIATIPVSRNYNSDGSSQNRAQYLNASSSFSSRGATFLSDGLRVLTWGLNGPAQLLSSLDGAEIGPAVRYDEAIDGVSVSGNKRLMLTRDQDGRELRLWDLITGEQIGNGLPHESLHNEYQETPDVGAVFSVDGSLLLTWNNYKDNRVGGAEESWDVDFTVKLWDTKNAQLIKEFEHDRVAGTLYKGHGVLTGAAISPDNTRLVTFDDQSVVLWSSFEGGMEKIWDSSEQGIFAIDGVSFSEDSRRFVTWGTEWMISGSTLPKDHSGTIVWDASGDGQVGPILQHIENVGGNSEIFTTLGAKFSPDGAYLATWGNDQTVRLWNISNEGGINKTRDFTVEKLQDDYVLVDAELSPNDPNLLYLMTDSSETLMAWNLETGMLSKEVPLSKDYCELKKRFDEAELFQGENIWQSKVIDSYKRWDEDEAGVELLLSYCGAQIEALSPDNEFLISTTDETTQLIDTSTGDTIVSVDSDGYFGNSATAFSANSSYVHFLMSSNNQSGDRIEKSVVLETSSGKQVHSRVLEGSYELDVDNLLFESVEAWPTLLMNDDTRFLGGKISLSSDGTRLLVWGLFADPQEFQIYNAPNQGVAIQLDVDTGMQIGSLITFDDSVFGNYDPSQSGSNLWRVADMAALWGATDDALTLRELYQTDVGKQIGTTFSSTRQYTLTWRQSTSIARLWDTATGKQIGTDLAHQGGVVGGIFSHDENRVLIWNREGNLNIWDSSTGQQIGRPMEHLAPVSDVWGAAFSPNDEYVISWNGGTMKLWDTASGLELSEILFSELDWVDTALVFGVQFSQDMTRIVAWGYEEIIQTGFQGSLAREWDISSLLDNSVRNNNLEDICREKLLGEEMRNLDLSDTLSAPMLLGREGEDVCESSPPWYQPVLRKTTDWLFQ